jgi:hypothetical protein
MMEGPLRAVFCLLGVFSFAAGCGAATDLDFLAGQQGAESGGAGGLRPAGTGGFAPGASGARGGRGGWAAAGMAPMAGYPGTGAYSPGGRRPIAVGGYGAVGAYGGRASIAGFAGMGAYPTMGGRRPVAVGGYGGRVMPPPAGFPGFAGRAAGGFGGVRVIPVGWICPLAYYDANDGCDCYCGAWDPDCSEPAQPVLGCALGQSCVPPGVCGVGGWACPSGFYGTRDGCDCNCGGWDPDCDDPSQQVFNCATVEICVYPGVCVGPLDE